MNTQILREALEALKRPAPIEALAASLNASIEETQTAIQILLAEGRCVETRSHKYAPLRLMDLTLCKARCLPGAPSFARPVDGGEDYFLDMQDEIALDGDLILVRPIRSERPRGTLVHVVKRAHALITGTVYVPIAEEERHSRRKKRNFRLSKPFEPDPIALIADRRLPARIPIEGGLGQAKAGDLCLFEVCKWPYRAGSMRVKINRVLGQAEDIGSLFSALLAQHGIEEAFSPGAVLEAARLPSAPSDQDMRGRRDLRDRVIFTIDGADAQDFDDAVSLDFAEGNPILGVHIADVSHYVRPGTALDADARLRGTSVYLPGRTVPMLPEALCNGLCSLRPDENRLTYSLYMTLTPDGRVEKTDLFPAVIRSCARLTYDDVNEMLAGRENHVPEALHGVLKDMNALAKRLKARRIARGALELDLAEPEFDLDSEGLPVAARARTRGEAHELIEEFMLLANETVAAHAQSCELPFPYRVHEAPDSEKLMALETFLADLGKPYRLGGKPTPLKLQQVLRAFADRKESVVVARTLLRSMSRARYCEKPLGHYGLAASDYCHFTSPIRRYPDLLAHRMLRMQAEGRFTEESLRHWSERMSDLTSEASDCEERAANCERDGDAMMCAAYLSRHLGQEVMGTVTHLGKRGAFVLLDNTAEGRVPPQLMDDFYSLDDDHLMMIGRRSRRVIRLGDRIRVEVYSADIAAGEVEFAMV